MVIADNDNTAIVHIANQTHHPLFQGDDRIGQLYLAKRIAAAQAAIFDTRFQQRVI